MMMKEIITKRRNKRSRGHLRHVYILGSKLNLICISSHCSLEMLYFKFVVLDASCLNELVNDKSVGCVEN